jgi:hypothetical protein
MLGLKQYETTEQYRPSSYCRSMPRNEFQVPTNNVTPIPVPVPSLLSVPLHYRFMLLAYMCLRYDPPAVPLDYVQSEMGSHAPLFLSLHWREANNDLGGLDAS